jgi:dTDP-4-amino-4,6-dideoxygalactose transaminase
VAERYSAALADVAIIPRIPADHRSVWAQYTLRIPGGRRDEVMKALAAEGIPTQIYYPKPLHHQVAYRHYAVAGNGLPTSERLPTEVLSLPMHPYLSTTDQDRIVDALRRALA